MTTLFIRITSKETVFARVPAKGSREHWARSSDLWNTWLAHAGIVPYGLARSIYILVEKLFPKGVRGRYVFTFAHRPESLPKRGVRIRCDYRAVAFGYGTGVCSSRARVSYLELSAPCYEAMSLLVPRLDQFNDQFYMQIRRLPPKKAKAGSNLHVSRKRRKSNRR